MRKLKFCVLEADYLMEDGKPVVRIWGKTSGGRHVVVFDRTFRPYFYIETKPDMSLEEVKELVSRLSALELEGKTPENVELVDKKFLGKPVRMLKVTLTNPTDVPKFRDLVKDWAEVRNEHEYMVSFYRRYLVDKGIIPLSWAEASGKDVETGMQVELALEAGEVKPLDEQDYPKLNVMAFDIEVVEEAKEDRVIMVSLMDSAGFDRVITYGKTKGRGVKAVKDEKALVEEFVKTVRERNPDIIVGYNSDRFDFLKLEESAERYGVPLKLGRDETEVKFRRRGRISSAKIESRIHIDLYNFVENILSDSLSSEVLTLDKISREILGIGKMDVEWKEIEESWRRGKELGKVVEYCRRDSELTTRLAKNLLPQIFELCRAAGQTLFDTSRMTYSQLVEWRLIREASGINEISPNRPKYDEIMRRRKADTYLGGYVHPPKEGIHDKIALFDFLSLYPSVIIAHNISPETLDCECCEGNEVPGEPYRYCRKHKGFVPDIVEGLVKKRREIIKRMEKAKPGTTEYRVLNSRQFAFKTLSNSFYGYYGYPGSRWYSRVCAKSITAWGRYYIQKVIRMAERRKLPVIYGDTDSLFLKIKNLGQTKEFLKSVNKTLPGIMELELKGVFERGIFIETKAGVAAKKKYALLDKEGNLMIRGMETRRRDWAPIAKKTQERVLLAVLRDKSPEKALRIVRRAVKEIQEGRVGKEDLVIYTHITRPLDKYEQVGPHVAAARKAAERGKLMREGSTVSYIITKGDGSISDRADTMEHAEDYDPEYYVNHQVIPAALRILSGLGFTEEELTGKRKQASLKRFIKGR